MSKHVKVFSPATIGNIGPGFAVLGLAVRGMGDFVEVWDISGDEIVIEEILNADHEITKDYLAGWHLVGPPVIPDGEDTLLFNNFSSHPFLEGSNIRTSILDLISMIISSELPIKIL